jgi:hypothetical protein
MNAGTEFSFQRYYKRWLGALPCLILGLGFNTLLERLPLKPAVYCVSCAGFMVILLSIYYLLSETWKVFRGKGFYWVEDNILYIQVGKKTYPIENVTELFGDVKSVFHSRHAVLLLEMGQTTIKLFSTPLGPEQGFAASSLYPLYSQIRSRADGLAPVQVLGQEMEYWHKKA